jgi:hypothetical protein
MAINKSARRRHLARRYGRDPERVRYVRQPQHGHPLGGDPSRERGSAREGVRDSGHQHSPSPLNPLGVKGVGEGGAVAPPAAIADAIADALAPFGAEFNTAPIKPEQIVKASRSAAT